MTWGLNCEEWHDDEIESVSLELLGYEDTRDDDLVLTTWHDDEPIEQVLWFAAQCAHHPVQPLEHTLIVQISEKEQADRFVRLAQIAIENPSDPIFEK